MQKENKVHGKLMPKFTLKYSQPTKLNVLCYKNHGVVGGNNFDWSGYSHSFSRLKCL